MKIILTAVILTISFLGFSQSDEVKVEQEKIRLTIDNLFLGMKNGDSSLVHTVFHPSARLVSCYKGKDNLFHIAEDSLGLFLNFVGTPHNEQWNEKITSFSVSIDQNLAQVWTDYEFYLGDEFSHCGVNAFHLVKDGNNEWKIIQLTDTRRKECEVEKE